MSESIDPRTRAFAIERARTRLKGERLTIGEPVLLDDGLWWVVRDDGGRRVVVARDDGRRAKEIHRWEASASARGELPGPALPATAPAASQPPSPPTPSPKRRGPVRPIDPWDLSGVPEQQTPTSERTLAWLRDVRDRFPGSPLEEWVALAESRNHRLAVGRWPPSRDD